MAIKTSLVQKTSFIMGQQGENKCMIWPLLMYAIHYILILFISSKSLYRTINHSLIYCYWESLRSSILQSVISCFISSVHVFLVDHFARVNWKEVSVFFPSSEHGDCEPHSLQNGLYNEHRNRPGWVSLLLLSSRCFLIKVIVHPERSIL